jgi:predicted transcriptional regulator
LSMITPAQIRGARAMLGISQARLSVMAGISKTGLANIEAGQSDPKVSTMESIIKVLEGRGIEFLGDDGVKLRKGAEPDSLR